MRKKRSILKIIETVEKMGVATQWQLEEVLGYSRRPNGGNECLAKHLRRIVRAGFLKRTRMPVARNRGGMKHRTNDLIRIQRGNPWMYYIDDEEYLKFLGERIIPPKTRGQKNALTKLLKNSGLELVQGE